MQIMMADAPRTRRKGRYPNHTFQIRTRPFAITPFMVAPVLPGETLDHLLLQARAVTDPIKNPLVGWWLEHYFFYVKHRDLAESAEFQTMMLNPDWSNANVDDPTSSQWFYHPGTAGNINWAKLAYIRVVETFFRDDGDAWNTYLIGEYAAAQIKQQTWLDSMRTVTADDTYDETLTVGGDDSFTMRELEAKQRMWQLQQMQGLTNQSYEEFLATYGVQLPKAELNEPELIRAVTNWQYPSNTVEPTTGVPSSAVSWVVNERADKNRFFKEPGVILGLTVARPKVYLSKQNGSAISQLNDVWSWLPATLQQNTQHSQKLVDNANALLAAQTTDYWIDVRDLFLYGDQWVNFSLSLTNGSFVALPTAAAQLRYPTSTDTDALFTAAGTWPDTPTSAVRQDGIVSLSIRGHVTDHTPTSVAPQGITA